MTIKAAENKTIWIKTSYQGEGFEHWVEHVIAAKERKTSVAAPEPTADKTEYSIEVKFTYASNQCVSEKFLLPL
jgi:hypothetical protein